MQLMQQDLSMQVGKQSFPPLPLLFLCMSLSSSPLPAPVPVHSPLSVDFKTHLISQKRHGAQVIEHSSDVRRVGRGEGQQRVDMVCAELTLCGCE